MIERPLENDILCFEMLHNSTLILLTFSSFYIFITPFQISILSVAETVRTCALDQCYKSLLSPATSETKRKMSTFISNIKASDAATQHAAGFQKAFQLLRNTSSLCKHSSSKKRCKLGICVSVLRGQFQLRCSRYLKRNQLSSRYLISIDVCCVSAFSHRHGDRLPVVRYHVSRFVRAGEESDAQCGQRGEPTPQQLGHDPHIRSHER